eukprot:CAMPEP_0198274036 /NCGR_PEP_ID=MMETSP1447-20131203/58901_1 /TAXON_ID=420782 /ORGANISM="Chaetoceros dichaeta, Strain CCMP1751" /LENGTH=263 /DNA_ID=CAMNT_0043967985 /DNA_START=11 /DNA_END=799 /DNA_ORIENTATION=-
MSFLYSSTASSTQDVDEYVCQPWEEDNWVPTTKSGKQKSPNVIRGEFQKHIDSVNETQTAIIGKLGINNNSFRKFMNPKTYKDQWSATQNGTYWAAARLLEQVKYSKEQETKAAKKRKRTTNNTENTDENAGTHKKSKSQLKLEAEILMGNITAVRLGDNDMIPVYDSCADLVKKCKEFLSREGVTKAAFCRSLGDLNQNSLNPFLLGKKQDQCGNITYLRTYIFFEQLRIIENKPKSSRRLKNEVEHAPSGFSLEKQRTSKW